MSSVEHHRAAMAHSVVLTLSCGLLGASCVDHGIAREPPHNIQQTNRVFPQSLEKDVDILFVIDNSLSMLQEQDNLALQFPRLIEALRASQLGGKLPNVHIGVVSTDLGAGPSPIESCRNDGGKLQHQAHGSCPVPRDPWISHINGQTNIEGGPADPVEQVKQAFSCIARLGNDGCGYEQQLEAARRALSEAVNPGFLRPDALLTVVFITDEDDCSARNTEIFNPMATHLGPEQVRCFLRGVTCSEQTQLPGVKHNCVPSTATPYLYPVEEYVRFLKGLKEEGRVLVAAISGPPDNVEVIAGEKGEPILKPSCQHLTTVLEDAAPAVRIKSLVDSFGGNGQFTTICTSDFGPALKKLGEKIVVGLGSQCLTADPLTAGGTLACRAGEDLGDGTTCKEQCLEHAECFVREVSNHGTPAETTATVARCAAAKFADPADGDCGEVCPCWRLVPRAECGVEHGTPYAVDILRRGPAPKGSIAHVACGTSPWKRGTPEFLKLPQC